MSAERVTDHALVRWLDRVGGIDMEWLRDHVAERCETLLESGASGGWVDQHWAVVKNGTVISFLPTHPGKKVAA